LGDQEKGVPHCWEGVSLPSGALRRFEFFAWWTRSQNIRTEGEVPFEAAMTELSKVPVYQAIAEQAAHLHLLGMNPSHIAVHLGLDRTTVTRALRCIRSP
jgi:hypothetical protein